MWVQISKDESKVLRMRWLSWVFVLFAAPTWALNIVITGGTETAQPIAVVPFMQSGTAQGRLNPAAVIANDLRLSGRFAPVNANDLPMRPNQLSEVKPAEWRVLDIPIVVIGRMQPASAGRIQVEYELVDAWQGRRLQGGGFEIAEAGLRRVAHRISDAVFEALTGVSGAFGTRIAYVSQEGRTLENRRYQLKVADIDGENEQVLLTSRQPILSPAWSPDGEQMAYVSFEQVDRASIWVQSLASGERRKIADFPGRNSAPAWSPDGKKLAFSTSRDGNPEVYVQNLASGALKRITQNPATDTEPVWSEDGKSLIYLSDRSGSAQIYRVGAEGGRAERLSFEGRYNASPAIVPGSELIVLLHANEGKYRVATLDPARGQLQLLSGNPLDESPSVAPNGTMVAYATIQGDRGVLEIVSIDGRIRQKVSLGGQDIREPAWSPYLP